MEKILRIAIISDLHCTQKESARGKSTSLHTTMPWTGNRNPIEAFKRLIEKDKIEADILLCPGDITDQINEQGFHTGWSYIEEMGRFLKVKEIYATLGNHDIASKLEKPEEAFYIAKNLKYNFPLPEDNQNLEFWGQNFSLIEKDNYRLFIYNSVYNSFNNQASKNVQIDNETLEKIKQKLERSDKSKFGIAMTHHHPINHYSSDYRDSDFIDKGDLLLQLLEENSFNLFIHGHKHQAMLRELNSISILASGSFSSNENLRETESENLFHIIDVSNKKGIINSWEYGPINGWHQKNSGTSFPNITGFGYSDTIENLACKINYWFEKNGVSSSTIKILKNEIEDIYHINPKNQKKLESLLKTEYSIEITPGIHFGDKANINKILQ